MQAPIFHVNGDSPQAAMRVAQIAFDYRQKFKKDVVIDMFCYRRHGHNEADDPSYTQPLLYRKIKEHPSVAMLYGDRLVREGVVIAAKKSAAMRKARAGRLSDAYDAAQKKAEQLRGAGTERGATEEIGAILPAHGGEPGGAGPRDPRDDELSRRTSTCIPSCAAFVERRRDAAGKGSARSTGPFGEALAFGTLVLEGTPVRLSGQDSGRGTFSQRHLAFYDSETERRNMCRCSTSRRTRRASTCMTARSASTRCWGSSSATAWRIR